MTYQQLVEQLIGPEQMRLLLEHKCTSIIIGGDEFVFWINGGFDDYCIWADDLYWHNGYADGKVEGDIENDLSVLYPALALLLTNPDQFKEWSG
jgi:hypothetical protein